MPKKEKKQEKKKIDNGLYPHTASRRKFGILS